MYNFGKGDGLEKSEVQDYFNTQQSIKTYLLSKSIFIFTRVTHRFLGSLILYTQHINNINTNSFYRVNVYLTPK